MINQKKSPKKAHLIVHCNEYVTSVYTFFFQFSKENKKPALYVCCQCHGFGSRWKELMIHNRQENQGYYHFFLALLCALWHFWSVTLV